MYTKFFFLFTEMLSLEETEELQVNEWWSDKNAGDPIRFRYPGFFFISFI